MKSLFMFRWSIKIYIYILHKTTHIHTIQAGPADNMIHNLAFATRADLAEQLFEAFDYGRVT